MLSWTVNSVMQFSYECSVEKHLILKTEESPHRTLKLTHGIDDSYKRFFLRSNCASIHQKNLWFLVTEIEKSISQINQEFMWSFFKQKKVSYNFSEPSSPTAAQRLFTFEAMLYGAIFLVKLNLWIQFLNLKPKLKICRKIRFADKLVLWQYLVYC